MKSKGEYSKALEMIEIVLEPEMQQELQGNEILAESYWIMADVSYLMEQLEMADYYSEMAENIMDEIENKNKFSVSFDGFKNNSDKEDRNETTNEKKESKEQLITNENDLI